jgi:hypothetical protein
MLDSRGHAEQRQHQAQRQRQARRPTFLVCSRSLAALSGADSAATASGVLMSSSSAVCTSASKAGPGPWTTEAALPPGADAAAVSCRRASARAAAASSLAPRASDMSASVW